MTSIGSYAFYGCSSLVSVTILGLVTSIENCTFFGCSSLQAINIPESVITVGTSTFSKCSSLISVTIPDSVTSIGDYVFQECSSLKSVTIPDSVTSIGGYAFRGCYSLVSITIPNSVTSIRNYAFIDCSNLTILCETASKPEGWSNNWNYSNRPVVWGYKSLGLENGYSYYVVNENGEDVAYIYAYSGEQSETLAIPSTLGGAKVVALGSGLFKGCGWLKTLIIPEGVTEIGNECFYQCTSLQSLVLPKSLTKIGERTLWYDSAFTTIYYMGTSEELAAIDADTNVGTEYFNATKYFYSEEEPQQTGNYWHYVDGAPTAW